MSFRVKTVKKRKISLFRTNFKLLYVNISILINVCKSMVTLYRDYILIYRFRFHNLYPMTINEGQLLFVFSI